MTVTRVLMTFPVCISAADDQGTGLTAMHTELTANETYHYQVIAQVDEVDAARSNIVAVVTDSRERSHKRPGTRWRCR